MANQTVVMASSRRMVLTGREGAGAIPVATVAAKFQSAMVDARRRLATAIALVSAHPVRLNRQQEFTLQFCFNPSILQRGPTFQVIRDVLTPTLEGLQTDDVEICDPDPTDLPLMAEGYVSSFLGIKGSIHTRFNLGLARTTFNLIHEGTHKFSTTVDPPGGYISANYPAFIATRMAGIFGHINLLDNATARTNADSFAQFAMGVT
jgi:hypothetical protein